MAMTSRVFAIGAAFLALAVLAAAARTPTARQAPERPPTGQGQQPAPEQPTIIETEIYGQRGAPAPTMAVPDFSSASGDGGEVGATIAEVLWADLQFEREYNMIPRNTYGLVQTATDGDGASLEGWRELGAEYLVLGTIRGRGDSLTVAARVQRVATGQVVFAKEYTGAASNPRFFAHTIADELHEALRGLDGVARTKLAFSSDRDDERTSTSYAERNVKEVYIADYDGENQRRVTVNRSLAINPVWTPDGRAIAYTSYRRGYPDIFISHIYQGRLDSPLGGTDRVHNFLPAVSPDGRRIAFMSNRDGRPEIYVANVDGSNMRRITNHPGNDTTPTWSPGGNEIAFTSNRSGAPQIYIASADGLGQPRRLTSESWADRATWSPPPFNEIAFAARTGPGFDIKVFDVARGQIYQITDGQGSNESPAWAPNGRHLAFQSTRSGRAQIFTVARDGRGLRQITRAGANYQPHWSR